MKICSGGAEVFHAARQKDRQTDITKLIVAFQRFAKAPKLECICITQTKANT